MKTVTLLILLVLCGAAAAQPGPDKKIETVIVTAPKIHAGVTPNAIAHDFVKSFAAPTALRDAIARWQIAICPDFAGLAPQYVAVMQARFRTIAAEAGAPMKEGGCKANLSIVFTPQPQAYLDAIHEKNMNVVGYHGTTTVSHPIQAWYVTGTQDNRGQKFLDEDGTLALDYSHNCSGCKPTVYFQSTNTAAITSVGGWRDRPDISSDILYVTIIVDAAQLGHYTVSEIADYVAMMALSRTEDYDDCQLMPSITNLLSPNCDDRLKPSEITPTDIAYLRGVYKMDAGAKLLIQQDQIAAEMAATLGGGK
jgi:hypothetical protein